MNNNDKPIIIYMHAGSGNHGCEAIANSFSYMLEEKPILISYYKDEDERYSLKDRCDIVQERSFNNHKLAHVLYYIYRKITKDKESFIRYRFKPFLSKKDMSDRYPVAVSIGGDNYCYDVMLNDLFLTNAAFNRQNTKTVLLGCSIEPELLDREDIKADLKKYSAIIARESITYEALCKKLRNASVKIYKIPDPAFTLKTAKVNLPEKFSEDHTVGINISPMIMDNESVSGIAFEAYKKLITYIIENTDMQIALIPHVIWERNNDMKPITALYEFFDKQGLSNRIVIIPDCSCEELKGYISKCRFFVGARTHSTIAAYSSLVPTLVVGYSVKAVGIAKDLFPEYDVDNMVLPVQKLQNEGELTERFLWIMEHESAIRFHLERTMPGYLSSAYEATGIVKDIRTGKSESKN